MNITRRKLLTVLKSFKGRRLGVVGDLMLDRYVWGTASRLSPEAAVPIVDYVQETHRPGGAANVAANLAALGARVEVFGVVGADDAGSELRSCVKETGIGDKGILVAPSRPTTTKTRIIARQHQVVRIDREVRAPLDKKLEEQLVRRLLASLERLDALVVSDYDKGVVTNGLADRLIPACHKAGVPVFVEPKASRQFSYSGAYAVVCNERQAGFFVGRPLADDAAVEEAGGALLAHFGCSAAVITRGDKGLSVFEEATKKGFSIPATNFEVTYARVGLPGVDRGATGRQVFDVTGAGDTVLATLALAVAAGASVREAAWLANAAAGVVVGKLGTATVSSGELRAVVVEMLRSA